MRNCDICLTEIQSHRCWHMCSEGVFHWRCELDVAAYRREHGTSTKEAVLAVRKRVKKEGEPIKPRLDDNKSKARKNDWNAWDG